MQEGDGAIKRGLGRIEKGQSQGVEAGVEQRASGEGTEWPVGIHCEESVELR